MKIIRLFFLSSFVLACLYSHAQNEISLAGRWHIQLDSQNVGLKQKWYLQQFSQPVELPGTLDDAGIGASSDLSTCKLDRDVLMQLTRKHSYIGVAWYSKEITIPSGWQGKDVILLLERVIWNTRVWVDGHEAGMGESLSVPHRFNLTGLLQPGKHNLVLRIDNTKQYDISIRNLAHAYTDGTQIIWNGVIGKIQLTSLAKTYITAIHTYPHVSGRTVTIIGNMENNTGKATPGNLIVQVFDRNNKQVTTKSIKLNLIPGSSQIETNISLGPKAFLWDEFKPDLYTVRMLLSTAAGEERASSKFGLREITAKNSQIQVNGRRVFIRGTLECDIFPLTGHPPMDKQGWQKVFSTAKSYGLNHLRFHSWCPPAEAFDVADSLGFYLQIELPLWSLTVGKDTATTRFLEQEANRISEEYGNHPSFCFWSMGNELEGDFDWLVNLKNKLKAKDNRHLYTTTTFSFQKGHGTRPEPGDDYFVTQYTPKGWVRGQGIFNTYAPDFSTDYSKSVDSLPVPLITHEIGQYSVYPNLEEIKKYTGVLDPLNFKAIRNDLERKNMIALAPAFTLASGKFSASLYKEEIERALKTKGISGFQLLDLHDFPGQGTALVGMLDAFWDSKGLVSPSEHRMYCSSVVPLIRFEKATYTNDEKFNAEAEVANFSSHIISGIIPEWTVKDHNGKMMFHGLLAKANIPVGNGFSLGTVKFDLNKILQAQELTFELQFKGTAYRNTWKFWVYPQKLEIENGGIVFTNSVQEAIEKLRQGKNVLLNPDTAKIVGVEGRFAPVFWSPVHFPNQPGTMGILCNPDHPALKYFPTDFYSGWQWWDLITSSKTMIFDSIPSLKPVVRVIDNFFKNRKMANILEARVGNGKLIIASVDLSHNLDKRPAARQLRYSLQQYMNSKDFSPETEITSGQLAYLIKD